MGSLGEEIMVTIPTPRDIFKNTPAQKKPGRKYELPEHLSDKPLRKNEELLNLKNELSKENSE